jgi:hypothetical protein
MFHDMTISELCDTPDHICEDNIYDLYKSENDNPFGLVFSLVIGIIHLILLVKYVKTVNHLSFVNVFSLILLILMFYIHYNYSHSEMCQIPKWCHEVVNNTIVENSYFYRMDKCPKYNAWLVSYYEDLRKDDYSRNHCDESMYGCCTIDAACPGAIDNDDTYSFYQLLLSRNNGWFTGIEKQDENGSNCPTIEEIIYEVSSHVTVINIKVEIYELVSIIILINIYVLAKIYCKREDKFINQSDIESGSDSNDDENQILKGSA